jgi:hypothetical protein
MEEVLVAQALLPVLVVAAISSVDASQNNRLNPPRDICHSEESSDEVRCRDPGGVHRTPPGNLLFIGGRRSEEKSYPTGRQDLQFQEEYFPQTAAA